MVGGDGVLPGGAARRLRLCPPADALRAGPGSVVIHLGRDDRRLLALPLHIATGWGKPPPVGEAFWLLGLFAVSIGLPFFALAANGPLLQAWFARTDHPAAKDPYFLYAASNVGSFLALISYPVVIEPLVRLGDQTRLWSIGFVLLILLIGACGYLLWRTPDHPSARRNRRRPRRRAADLARCRDLGRARGGARRGSWSRSPRISRPTSRRCRCCG